MEKFQARRVKNTIEMEGFPDAVNFIQLHCQYSKRFQSLILHHDDFTFVLNCLEQINTVLDNQIIRDALWTSAVFHYSKCFGKNKSRRAISPDKIHTEPGALNVHNYIISLRDKHYAHDENPFIQAPVGAIINPKQESSKVGKILCLKNKMSLLTQQHWETLYRLTERSIQWIEVETQRLADIITDELETHSHEDLASRERVMMYEYSPVDVEVTRGI